MCITDEIAELIRNEISIDCVELVDFDHLLKAAAEIVARNHLNMTHERWLSLGNHLVTTLRRAKTDEKLAPVDESVLNQVDAEMFEWSKEVFGTISATTALSQDATEVLLLAIHFAAAKDSL